MDGDAFDGDVVRTHAFLDRFLAVRVGRTRHEYQADIEDFAHYMEESPASAVARLLGAGPTAGRRMAMDYAVELLGAGRGLAAVGRRLGTLRTLAREAHRTGLVGWLLEIPNEEDAAAEAAKRGTSAGSLLPRQPAGIDRLDVRHHALREHLGANYLAPIAAPGLVLDAGCGSGQWGFDLCAELPGTRVIGLDLVPGRAVRPDGCAYVRGDILQGLPFRGGRFDFVHQRFLVADVPLVSWPAVVADLVRTLRPGGWIELVEPRMVLEPAGPATARLFELTLDLAGARGLDTGTVVADSIDDYLRQAGLTSVDRHDVTLPIGRWGGRVGDLMASDARGSLSRTAEVLHSLAGLPREEGMDLVEALEAEFEEHRTTFRCAIATGRKPPLRHV
jgi:SAM-dependent methyltransferase